MLSRVRNVFVISALGVLGGILKNILLARELTKEELGIYSLLMTIVGFVYPLTLLGQHNAIVRFMADKDFSEYNWPKKILQLLFVSFCLTVLAVGIFRMTYDLKFLAMTFLLLATLGTVGTDVYASIYRAQGKYEISMVIFRILSLLLPLAIFLLLILKMVTLSNILILFSILYALVPLVMVNFVRQGINSGSAKIPKSVWKDGIFLWGADLSLLVIVSIDKFLIPKLITYQALGEYFAIFSITRAFDLVLRAFEMVLLPHLKKSGTVHLGSLLSWVLGSALILSAFYLLAGDTLVELVFKGKYSNSSSLIPFFCVLGTIRLLHVIPYSVIGGLLKQHRLKQMFHINILTIFLAILLSFFLINNYGLVGAVTAGIAVWAFKTLAGFGIMFKDTWDSKENFRTEGTDNHE